MYLLRLSVVTVLLASNSASGEEVYRLKIAGWGAAAKLYIYGNGGPASAFVWQVGGGRLLETSYHALTFEGQVFGFAPCFVDGPCNIGYVTFDFGFQGGANKRTKHGFITIGPTAKAGVTLHFGIPQFSPAVGLSMGINRDEGGDGGRFVIEPRFRVYLGSSYYYSCVEVAFLWGFMNYK